MLWAERVGGEILNADSMQIYQGLEILSAAPGAEARRRVRHHLYGAAEPEAPWSAGDWARAAAPRLAALRAEGKAAVVVGGTGLYFRVLTKGLAEIPPIPARVHEEAVELLRRDGEAAVRRRLKAQDPVSEARIAPHDAQRMVRALGVLVATGRPLSAWGLDARPVLEPGSWRGLVLAPERSALHRRARERLNGMVRRGALEEVSALIARRLDPTRGAMKALGVRELSRALQHEITLEEAVEQAAAATQRYIKRQTTWFSHQAADWAAAEDTAAGVERLQALRDVG